MGCLAVPEAAAANTNDDADKTQWQHGYACIGVEKCIGVVGVDAKTDAHVHVHAAMCVPTDVQKHAHMCATMRACVRWFCRYTVLCTMLYIDVVGMLHTHTRLPQCALQGETKLF